MAPESVDAVVCDPQYGLSREPDIAEVLTHWLAGDDYTHRGGGFMGKTWDSFVPGPVYWREAFRVVRPGGHVLAFGGTRTSDLLTIALRFAGFEIRDSLIWLYGSGFPKSLDVSKAIDKAAGMARAEGEYDGPCVHLRAGKDCPGHGDAGQRQSGATVHVRPTVPGSPETEHWQGWGTALKPGYEPIVVARKPLIGTVAANVLEHGTGALNIDGCRIGGPAWTRPGGPNAGRSAGIMGETVARGPSESNQSGRWPANVVLDEDAAAELDRQSGECAGMGMGRVLRRGATTGAGMGYGSSSPQHPDFEGYGDSGGASRFFYVAKASRAERGAGLNQPCRCSKIPAWRGRDQRAVTRADEAISPPRATTAPSSEDASDSSTIGSGSKPTDLSPMASKSTIATRTNRTTIPPTSNSSPPSITSESTPRTTDEPPAASGSDDAAFAANGSRPMPSTTTSPARDGSSTADADPATSGSSSQPSSGAEVCPDCGGVVKGERRNAHPLEPTVKPIALMRWLVRLVTPPDGLILDPFAGSGTTGCAAVLEGFDFIGLEREPEYVAIALARIAYWADRCPEEQLILGA